MRVLVVGSGAREHALAARLASEPGISQLVCAPGNPGIASSARLASVPVDQPEALLALAQLERIDLTIVGPELPLSLGIADRFSRAGCLICGPSAAAAQLESSKAFAKEFMARHRVPTAAFRVCDTVEAALAALRSGDFGVPVVLKADGLAAGKGVVVAGDLYEAEAAVAAAMTERRFGSAGARLVVEECLVGPEVSFFVITDGTRVVPIGAAQDHKRVRDDDRGPNTGGMGAFAPTPLMTASLERRIMRDIVEPVVLGMASEGRAFKGFLYVGLMLTSSGPKVIEFNVRLGDPEAQVVLPLIDEPLLPLLAAVASGQLEQSTCRLLPDKLVGVVLASRGYPESPDSGHAISGIEAAEALPAVSVYHAGTARRNGQLVTAGGRVLTVVGRGREFGDAIERAYAGVIRIAFDGMQYRHDIGRKALQSAASIES